MNSTDEELTGSFHATPTPPPESESATDDPRVVQALREYQAAVKAGRRPERDRFLADHPAIAEALAECLDGLELLQEAAPALRESAEGSPIPPDGFQPEGPLGDFRILREVGRGGMGVVYEAVQVSLGRRVALKVLPLAAAFDRKQLQRFQHEARAAAHLHHTNIVPVHAVGCERGVHFYAMQFIDGQSLAAVIRQLREQAGLVAGNAENGAARPAEPSQQPSPPTPPEAAPSTRSLAGLSTDRPLRNPDYFRSVARLGVQAAEALEYAHSQGVVHRDIKPANLLLDDLGHLWVTDFGLARFHNDAGLTQTGDIVGTLRYMSPEQALARHGLVDHRTDVYALGATLYELLALRPAVEGRDRQELLRHIERDEPRPLRWLNPAAPKDLETIVHKALAKEVAARYATAQELADDLRRFLDAKPIQARPPSLWERARKWAWRHSTAMAAAVVVLVLAVAGLSAGTILIGRAKNQADDERRRAEEAKNQADVDRERAEQARKTADDQRGQAEQARKLAEDEKARAEKTLATLLNVVDTVCMPALLREHYQSRKPLDAQARKQLQALFVYYENLAQEMDRDPADRTDQRDKLARYCKDLGFLLHYTDRAISERAYRRAIRLHTAVAGDSPADAERRDQLARLHHQLGLLLQETGRFEEAGHSFRAALALHETLMADRPKVASYQSAYAGTQLHLGRLLALDPKRTREAADHYYHALDRFEKLFAASPADAKTRLGLRLVLRDLTALARSANEPALADAVHQRLLNLLEREAALLAIDRGATSEFTGAVDRLAWILATSTHLGPAAAERVADITRQVIPRDKSAWHPWNTLGAALYRAGQYQAAIEAIHKSMDMKRGGNAEDGFFLAMAYWKLGNKAKATQMYNQAVQWREKRDPEHGDLLRFQAEAAALLTVTPPPQIDKLSEP